MIALILIVTFSFGPVVVPECVSDETLNLFSAYENACEADLAGSK